MAEAPQCAVPMGQYIINLMHKLGQGGFGVVYKGVDTKRDVEVAAKQIEIRRERGGADAMAEIKILQKVPEHVNIIRLYDFHFFRNSFWIIMEYCNCGDLRDYLKKYAPVALATKVDFMRQMAAAVHHMHTLPEPVAHRDLKPPNILLRYTGSDERPVIKVTDFGLSKVADVDLSKTFMMSTQAGTPCFMAPEQFGREGYTASVDIFALGLMFVGMINFEKTGDIIPTIPDNPGSMLACMIMPIGIQMNQAAKTGGRPVRVVKLESSDDPVLKQVKELIQKMVLHKREDRCTSQQVFDSINRIYEEIKSSLPPPPPRPGKTGETARSRTPLDVDTDAAAAAAVAGLDDDEDDLGYRLLRQAMQQHMEDKIQKRKKGGRKDALLKELGKGVPLLEMLLHHAIDDDSPERQKGKRRDDSDDDFPVGSKVRVMDVEVSRAKEMQRNYGGWVDLMKHYLGKEGTVGEKLLHTIQVRFSDGLKWAWNPALLQKINSDGTASEQSRPRDKRESRRDFIGTLFKRYDVVQIASEESVVKLLQEGHGGWMDEMKQNVGVKGIVNNIDSNGDVFVECINGGKWYFNPEVLIKVDPNPNQDFDAGDFVIIKDVEVSEAKALQAGHGEWHSSMEKALGKTGIVKSVLTGDRVKVEVAGHTWIFNKALLLLVANAEEMMHGILLKKMNR
ncbi:uncharacterized protein LOC106156501 [Lingula anatina]|uniref:Uncharacterized protein LOC106156501 n=1 Tax=Lingula anatina TaxID=7574 RepID=A0A2R2MM49_LINAN|nr:uncharacterized protein LOC106156501 [Lingula anatina]|eukprot:XP_023931291.1 uncharacterized protein LOC106156501 [Lingula anatina]